MVWVRFRIPHLRRLHIFFFFSFFNPASIRRATETIVWNTQGIPTDRFRVMILFSKGSAKVKRVSFCAPLSRPFHSFCALTRRSILLSGREWKHEHFAPLTFLYRLTGTLPITGPTDFNIFLYFLGKEFTVKKNILFIFHLFRLDI